MGFIFNEIKPPLLYKFSLPFFSIIFIKSEEKAVPKSKNILLEGLGASSLLFLLSYTSIKEFSPPIHFIICTFDLIFIFVS